MRQRNNYMDGYGCHLHLQRSRASLRMHRTSTCIGLLFGAGWGRVATSYRNHTHRQQLRSNHKTEENCRVTDCAAVTTGSPAQPHHGSSTANLPRGLIVRRVCAAVRRYFGAADNTHQAKLIAEIAGGCVLCPPRPAPKMNFSLPRSALGCTPGHQEYIMTLRLDQIAVWKLIAGSYTYSLPMHISLYLHDGRQTKDFSQNNTIL